MDYLRQQDARLRKIKLVRNGNPEKLINITLKQSIRYPDLLTQILDAMGFQKSFMEQIRIYRKGGVEVDPEEVDYIKDHEILYISKGEEFDEGSHFAEYKLLRELGQGGFGKVYEAKHRMTKEKVAIKVAESNRACLNSILSSENAKDVEMMFKEISALKNLKHKNILKILNAFTLKKEMKVVLVLEYLDGGELKKYVKDNERLGEDECQWFFKQLYHAISYCHREKIIHRDLKLENIMLTDLVTKQIKVVDFGISGMCNNINIDYTEAGSIRYLAPEVIQYKAPANSSIDIWAMGVILYWMLHGYPPFDGQTKQSILEKILKNDYRFNVLKMFSIDEEIRANSSRAVIDLIERMLTDNPKTRITIFEIGNHPWILKNLSQILQEEQQLQLEEAVKFQEILFQQQQQNLEKQEEEKNNQDKLRLKQRKSFAAPTQSYLNRFNQGNEKSDSGSEGPSKLKQRKSVFGDQFNKIEINEFLAQKNRSKEKQI